MLSWVTNFLHSTGFMSTLHFGPDRPIGVHFVIMTE